MPEIKRLKCAYVLGCNNDCPKNQKYCSREHSPFGYLCKENYFPPRKGHSIYRPTPPEAPKLKRDSRKYSRKPQPDDFINGEEKTDEESI